MISASIRQAYDSLQQRERYFVSAGGVFILIAVIYWVLMPFTDRHNQLIDQQTTLQADLSWLHDQTAIVPRLVNSCSGRHLNAGSDTDIITKLVRRTQLRLDKITETGRGISLRVNGPDANRMIRLAHQISCEGFTVQTITINDSASGVYTAALEVQRVN